MSDMRWREFLEDEDGRGSSTRLYMGLVVVTLIVIAMVMTVATLITAIEKGSSDIGPVGSILTTVIGALVTLTGGGYAVGKLSDNSVNKAAIKSAPAETKGK